MCLKVVLLTVDGMRPTRSGKCSLKALEGIWRPEAAQDPTPPNEAPHSCDITAGTLFVHGGLMPVRDVSELVPLAPGMASGVSG